MNLREMNDSDKYNCIFKRQKPHGCTTLATDRVQAAESTSQKSSRSFNNDNKM